MVFPDPLPTTVAKLVYVKVLVMWGLCYLGVVSLSDVVVSALRVPLFEPLVVLLVPIAVAKALT